MKKKIIILLIIFSSLIIFYLNSDGVRYTSINYEVSSKKVSNYQKIKDFYFRHQNYEKLVNKILFKNKETISDVEKISVWVYKNINKISDNDIVIDSHPWTIIKRKIGTSDQFSDILSVLLVHNNIESFFTDLEINNRHPLTYFNYNNKWSIIDPYYGIFFRNNKNEFSSLNDLKNSNWKIFHLEHGIVNDKNCKIIFKNFKKTCIQEMNTFYLKLFLNILSEKKINKTNIYERGGRSYIQKPFHRIIFHLKHLITR
jgi:hypothetical protein